MAALPNLSASVASAQNQNIASLVNVNIDISLVRCDPSPEFVPIGKALTQRRKAEAENGPFHKLACRLGFLFNEVVPDTPKLRDAYGTRASSIIQRPDINPRGTTEDGPFQEYVGADGTSIWAAATSVPASISLYLLACMLAHAWEAREATSIWYELVHERKRRIQADLDQNKLVNPHTYLAAQQDISRVDLAKWDASARSWLRRADQSMRRERTQFKLIADNLVLPFIDSGSTYDKVTKAWIRSMEVIEKLMNNVSQMACDRGVLLAISSWHLYPNLLVFQDNATSVPFNDKLFPGAAVLTLGLEIREQRKRPEHLSTVSHWSLSLSHLKYYGGPVQARGEELQRVSSDQLWLLALGSILRQWKVPLSSLKLAVQWFKSLGDVLLSQHQAQVTRLSWLFKLCESAKMVIDEDCGSSAEDQMALITFAWRRATRFLGSGKTLSPPFFGLCNPDILCALKQRYHTEVGLDYLRRLASRLKLPLEDTVIFRSDADTTKYGAEKEFYGEWATISPVRGTPMAYQDAPGLPESAERSASKRWIHCQNNASVTKLYTQLKQRKIEINNLGEQCEILANSTIPRPVTRSGSSGSTDFYEWERAPRPFSSTSSPVKFIVLQQGRLINGSIGYRLCVRKEKFETILYKWVAKISAAALMVDLGEGVRWLTEKSNAQRTALYLSDLFILSNIRIPRQAGKRKRAISPDSEIEPNNQSFFTQDYPDLSCLSPWTFGSDMNIPQEWISSLRALEIVSVLYEQLPHATISLKIIDFDLCKAKWLPQNLVSEFVENVVDTSVQELCKKMTRANSIACIAMFESGQYNINIAQIQNVVALCSEDSIYVAGILLSDPSTKELGMTVHHLVGNIGHPGMVLMIAPTEPQVRSPGYDARLVRHRLYDGDRTDSFRGTSMHLSFTSWETPLNWGSTGRIGQQIFLIESVISIQDSGKWVADLDVLSLERCYFKRMKFLRL